MLRTCFLFCLLVSIPSRAQIQFSPPQFISADEALDRVLKNNVLTSDGPPFHAVLEIKEIKDSDPAFTGRVELFWQDKEKYRLILESPNFGQTLIVNTARVMETDRGDFYPNWLNNFVTALMDPMPRLRDLRGRGAQVAVGPTASFS